MIKVGVIGVQTVNKNLDKKGKDIIAAALRGLYTGGMLILADSKQMLKQNGSIATGQLRDSGIIERGKEDIDVVFKAEQAAYVEFGRRAGIQPPTSPLVAWVMKKGLADTYTAGGNRRGRGNDFMKRVQAIAFLIARKIGKVGIKAKPFLYPSMRKNENRIQSIVSNEIRKTL